MSDAASLNEPVVLATESTHRASDGCKLFVYRWSSRQADAGRGAVVALLHGYAEHSGRYREVAEFLVGSEHPVMAVDARGHGRSPGPRGHIDSYERYVDDAHGFALSVRQQYPNRPLVVLGHSNGGLTALRMVQTRPAVADALVLTCPLVELRRSHQPVPLPVASLLSKWIGWLPLPNGLKPSELTHDEAILEIQRRDPLNHKVSTPRWYVSTMHAMQQSMASLNAVQLPVLVVGADSDPIVQPEGVRRMYEGLASTDKELVVCSNAFHEVLNEIGRERTYRTIGAWIDAHAKLAH
jgi:lysophospholipase